MKEYTFDSSRYVQIPYQEHGDSWTGVDCFGLARLVLCEETGVYLPDFRVDDWASAEAYFEYFDPVPIREVQIFDVIVISKTSLENADHCGVVIGFNKMIHAMSNIGVTISKISTWMRRIKGVYRHKALE